MYLTEFAINVGRRSARNLLSNPERIHAAVLGCFPPGQSSDETGRTLWRLERRANHDVALMIASPLVPDLTALNESAGWQTGEPGRTADYSRLLSSLEVSQRWRFRLVGNPVHSAPMGTEQRGKRYGHVTTWQQMGWLLKQSENHGFYVGDKPENPDDIPEVSAKVARRDVLSFTKGAGTKHRVTISQAQFDGVLTVVDADKLRRSLCFGIGKAKSYGCGLLTLAPVR